MQPITKRLSIFILYFVRAFKWHFFAMACCRLSFVLDNVVVPYTFQCLVDRLILLSDNRAAKIGWPLAALVTVLVLIELLFRLFDYIKIKTIPSFERNIRSWIIGYLQGHSYRFFTGHFSGGLVKRVNDLTDGVCQIIMTMLSSFWPAFCSMIVGMLSFANKKPVFGGILIIWLVLHIATYFIFIKKYGHYVALHAEKRSRLSGSIVDGFTNILTVKLFAKKNQAAAHLVAPQAAEKEAYEQSLKMIMYFHFIISFLFTAFMSLGFIFYMIHYWRLGKLTISDVTYIFYVGSNLCNTVWISVLEFPDLFEAIGYCKQALKLLQKEHAVVDLPTAHMLRCQSAAIEYKNICFSYTSGKTIFENQSVSIAAGEKVGLVGLSGSGKTTFVHLLLRFFNLNKGMITIDGQDIATVTQESLRAAIALIPQDTTLFHDTILENIRYGRKEATDSEVIAVAKKAKCHDFILSLPEGYHTFAGERGTKLSGGQRQRIAIARAILKNAPILILDEATSALDAVTEREIQLSLADVMVGKTTIVIAHRLATLVEMNRILVFDHGSIITEGTHAALLRSSPMYANIYRLQSEVIAIAKK